MAAVTARANYIGMSPRKVRLVADLVRGKSVGDALSLLQAGPKQASRVLLKLLRSAVANAEQREDLDPDTLVVKTITVDSGPTSKRYRPRALGRATRIRKRTSKIRVVLAEAE
ncbi:MAG: 50S ribosomal protein L22 [Deltaproteobacteria bacterium RBG_13_61_14]|nr:MAG: 50S ribosomal protein L22 [Deltaproteobacteria bacterium RBG_13_61_14]